MDLSAEPAPDLPGNTDLLRARAIAAAASAIDQLSRQGVTALVTGSLATGSFHEGSDIDLLVIDCPRWLKYAIEADVEDAIAGFRFDVIYLDEVSLLPIARAYSGKLSMSGIWFEVEALSRRHREERSDAAIQSGMDCSCRSGPPRRKRLAVTRLSASHLEPTQL